MKVIIAGSGVIGLWTAYFLQEAGHEVTVMEKDHGPSGSSMGNAGMVVPSHFMPLSAPGVISQSLKWLLKQNSPLSIKPRLNSELIKWGLKFMRSSSENIPEKRNLLYQMNHLSGEIYREVIEKRNFKVGYQPRGLAMFCKSEKALEEEASLIPLSKELGQEALLLSAQEAKDLDSGIEMDIAGAVYYPGDAFMAPHDLMIQLRDYLEQEGVKFHHQTPLDSIRVSKGKLNAFVSGETEFSADEFVIATGAWSNSWKSQLGVNIPLQAGKGYSFTLQKPPALPSVCSILVEARIAVTPMYDTLRFAGTMELSGLDPTINKSKVRGIKQSIPSYFPEFSPGDFENLDIWYGYRPVSPDGLPYVGRIKHISNLCIATGHAMMGFSMGPVTGKMVRDIISGTAQNEKLLDPARFG